MRFLYHWLSCCRRLLAVWCLFWMKEKEKTSSKHTPQTHSHVLIPTSTFISISHLVYLAYHRLRSYQLACVHSKHKTSWKREWKCILSTLSFSVLPHSHFGVRVSVHLFSITIRRLCRFAIALFSIFYGLCLLSRSMELSLASNTLTHSLTRSHTQLSSSSLWITFFGRLFGCLVDNFEISISIKMRKPISRLQIRKFALKINTTKNCTQFCC